MTELDILHDYFTEVRCMTEGEWKRFSSGYDVQHLDSMTSHEFGDYLTYKKRVKRECKNNK